MPWLFPKSYLRVGENTFVNVYDSNDFIVLCDLIRINEVLFLYLE